MHDPASFQPGQILHLTIAQACLYAETIQFIPDRCLVWVRPLALQLFSDNKHLSHQPIDRTMDQQISDIELYDLRQGADLVYPASLFQLAIDTDVIPILASLDSLKSTVPISFAQKSAHEQLQQFAQLVWQSYPTQFCSH